MTSTNAVKAQTANFSGVWSINEKKSDFAGQQLTTMYKQIKIVQTSDSLSVFGMRFGDQNISNKATTYPLNGDSVRIYLSNNRTMTASLKWSKDEKSFTRNSSYSFPDEPNKEAYKTQEIWSLINGGKTLLLKRTFLYGDGNSVEVNAAYDKQ
jgi:hypothetical protein